MNDVLRIELEAALDHARHMFNRYNLMQVPIAGERWRDKCRRYWEGEVERLETKLQQMAS